MVIKDTLFNKGGSRLAVLLIVLITALAYANSLRNSFVCDDFGVIVNNDFIKTWKNFPLIFSKTYFMAFKEITYRPVVSISYFIDYSTWGLNPFGYHLTNLVLHIINAIMLYFLINLIGNNKNLALLTSLFFAVHPINTEAVNVISFREDLLAFLFYLSAIILYLKQKEQGTRKKSIFYFLSFLFFIFALFSKEMAVTLPIVLLLFNYFFIFPKKPIKKLSDLKSLIGYLVILVFYFGIRFFLMKNVNEERVGYLGNSFLTSILTMFKVYATYVFWLFFPGSIKTIIAAKDDPLFIVSSPLDISFLLSFAVIIFLILFAIDKRKIEKEISFSIFWFFITLLPVSNIMPINNYMALRYLYLPSVSFCLFMSIVLIKLKVLNLHFGLKNIPAKVVKYIIIFLLSLYAIFTVDRNCIWKDNATFALELYQFYKDKNMVIKYLYPLSSAKVKQGQRKAIEELKEALQANPNSAELYNKLGIAFGEINLYNESVACFKKAINIDPKYLEAYGNLGVAYARLGKWREAEKIWGKILEISPEDKEAQHNLKKLKRLDR